MIISHGKFNPNETKNGFVIDDVDERSQLKIHEEIPKTLPTGAILLKPKRTSGYANSCESRYHVMSCHI